MRWGCLVGPAVLLAFAAAAEPLRQAPEPAPIELSGRVVAIADGDTLTLLVEREQVRVRLAQIDAPEKGQPYGRAARQALSELAFGKQARVVVIDTDRYGRSVGEVFVGGLHVNEAMVRRGHAWAYREYSRSDAIIELEDEARAAQRGLWALPVDQRQRPWLWRRRGSASAQAIPRTTSFACGDQRTCKQMTSCEEARFHLEQCGAAQLDGDRDGIPCEALCAP